MMHRCGGAQGNTVGPCSCGLFHSQASSFSMFFSVPTHNHRQFDDADVYDFSSSPSSSVDCTLSLGTPSTRVTTAETDEKRVRHDRRSVSNFCWDLLHPRHGPPPPSQKPGRGGNNYNVANNNSGNSSDPLLARRCANCDTTSTPLWRNGPRGPKSLCNACGIRFKKEERRASAAAANNSNGGNSGVSGVVMEANQYMISNNHNNSWLNHSQPPKSACYSSAVNNEYRFIDDDNRNDPDNGISFLSWRLNVTDRPGLVHDFTR